MIFQTPNWIAWPRWVSTGSGSSASGRLARVRSKSLAANAEWRREFQETLPDLREEDIAGSGFAITGYTVHKNLGGDAALARLRERLRTRGLRSDARLRAQSHGARSSLGRRITRSISSPVRSSTWPELRRITPGSSARAAICSWPTAAIPISPAGPTPCSSTTPTPPRKKR